MREDPASSLPYLELNVVYQSSCSKPNRGDDGITTRHCSGLIKVGFPNDLEIISRKLGFLRQYGHPGSFDRRGTRFSGLERSAGRDERSTNPWHCSNHHLCKFG